MSESARIIVPAAENDSYWLDVEGPPGYPGSAGYVRAVVVSTEAANDDRQKAAALAEAMNVPLQDEQKSAPRPSGQSDAGISFTRRALERLGSPFSQGASEGRRTVR